MISKNKVSGDCSKDDSSLKHYYDSTYAVIRRKECPDKFAEWLAFTQPKAKSNKYGLKEGQKLISSTIQHQN
jgi:hypothetical protein